MTLAHVLRRQLGQCIGRIHEGVFHGLAHAGLHFVHEHTHHEEASQSHDQEIAEEYAQANLHALVFRL